MTTKSRQNETITDWITWQRASGTPDTTISLRRYYLRRLAADHRAALLSLDLDALASWIAAADWSPNTRKSVRSALRSFYGWAVHTGRIDTSPAHLLPPVRIPRAKPRPTNEADYRLAIVVADQRARLAILLAAQCGLRRGEIARIRAHDVHQPLTGYSLRVVGKGGHVRNVPLPDALAEELLACEDWAFPSPAA